MKLCVFSFRMEEVKSSIKIILPAITDELLESLLSVLVDLGVDDIHHLELVEESDLTPVLKKIQARLLVKEWRKNKEHIESTNQATVVVEENSMPIETVPSTSKPKYERTFFNPHTYNIPWESMPEELLRSLNENKRPKPTLRQKMVRIISDHIHQQIKRPGVKILAVVAERIVHQYPQSFTDEVSSQINGTSHLSLLKQLERRLDNINRGDIINVLKRKSKNNDETIKKVKLSDSYGCVNYQPDLPLTETTQSQAEKQQMMKESYATNGAVLNTDNRTLLQDTYSSIRIDINSGKNLQFLTVEWPLLFTKEGFIDHFNTLVDVNVERKLGLAISKLGVTIISYFLGDPKVKPSAKDKLKALTEELKKNAQQKEDMFTWPILISLLMTYFQDDIDTLFVIVEIASSVGEVEMSVPNTPCLICCGYNMQNVTSFMLAIDSKIVIMEIETFEMGLALLISSFFCLNIEYPASASTTLEFIQRCFLDINPLKGSKVDSSKKMKGVNPKIVSLKKKITDFEWNL